MKKDIVIPEVENVHVIAIQEWSKDFESNMWYIYLLNTNEVTIEMPIVISQAKGSVNNVDKTTSSLRHTYKGVAPFNAIRLEMLTDDLLELDNIFQVTYFKNDQLYDKNFIFKANSIAIDQQIDIEVLQAKGIFAK